MPYSERGRQVNYLLSESDKVSRALIAAHNASEKTDQRHLVNLRCMVKRRGRGGALTA